MKPLTLVINQNNTAHKLELAKAVTFSNQATHHRLTEIEDKDAKQDERLTAVEAKNIKQDERLTAVEDKDPTQDKKIADLEAEMSDLKASQATIRDKIVEVRYYQSVDKPIGLPPGPAKAIMYGKLTVAEINKGLSVGFLNGKGSLTNNRFKIGDTDYKFHSIESNYNSKRFNFYFNKADDVGATTPISNLVFDDICVRVGQKAYVLSEARAYFRAPLAKYKSGISFIFDELSPPLTADDVGAEIDIAIEPLDWTTTLPPFRRKIGGQFTELYMAIKVGGVWQVVRVNHPGK